jgi:subtilisin-like proprotein convertase family protein
VRENVPPLFFSHKRNFQMEGNMRPALVLSGLCLALNLYAQSVVTYSATDVPVHIPDGPNGRAESFISIEPWYVILDVNVVVTITHTYDQDLRLYLEAPDHSVVILAYECGQERDNFIDTRFDDEAQIDICDGQPPFTGNYRPFHSLDILDGQSTHGLWTFRVTDNWASDTGSVQAWRMEILVDTTASVTLPPLANTITVEQNYPNPFNPTTVLPVQLAKPGRLDLTIFNELGRIVSRRAFDFPAGSHILPIDGTTWSSGAYFAQIRTGNEMKSVQMQLVK